uniref:Secreted protein n=1 Tax=Heterorhabditis bacteriophora TaxID=37862 RepID=A0A1I7XP94_HETBA
MEMAGTFLTHPAPLLVICWGQDNYVFSRMTLAGVRRSLSMLRNMKAIQENVYGNYGSTFSALVSTSSVQHKNNQMHCRSVFQKSDRISD